MTLRGRHVDHDPPIAVNKTADGETLTLLAERGLAARWSAFHAERARLRLISRRANLSLLRRKPSRLKGP